MKTRLALAREEARKARAELGGENPDLLERLRKELEEKHGLEVLGVDGEKFLQGGRGEVVPEEGCLYYDRRLENKPEEWLEVLAHEFGHVRLHNLEIGQVAQDLIRGSAFLNSGAGGISRYSPRSQYEAEASAFAAEFICPAQVCFERWRGHRDISIETLTQEFFATPSLVRLQLAEGLYEAVTGSDGETAARQSIELPPTPEQERAATACGTPLLLDAGPGTGKTKTLVRRVEYLVKERQVPPENILVVTFSNEAAAELQERIHDCVGQEAASKMYISTFHGLGVLLLNVYGHHVDLGVDFSILDDVCQEELMSEILGLVECDALINIKDLAETASNVVRTINYLKDRLIGPAELREAIGRWRPEEEEVTAHSRARALLSVFEAYETEKGKRQLVDFADLIRVPHELLSKTETVREELRRAFPWVLVDEYQDVSRATALLLRVLCGGSNPPWVVGDARQAIYRFRGAAPENVRMFGQDFPGARSLQLSENYRSSPEIISVINRLAGWLDGSDPGGPGEERWKPGRTVLSHGDQPVVLAKANNDTAERLGVVDRVARWIIEGVPAEEVAVLARRNVDVRNVAVDLKRAGIRAVTSGLLTSEGAGGDLAGVLTAVDHQQAFPRLAYALVRKGLSRDSLNEIISAVLATESSGEDQPQWTMQSEEQRKLASELWEIYRGLRSLLHSGDGWAVLCDFLFFLSPYLRELLEKPEEAESTVRLEEVLSALSLAANYRFTHPHLPPRLSRLGMAERMREMVTQSAPGLVAPRKQRGAVRVMTCHASKGLEFPNVAIIGQSLPNIRGPKECLPPNLRVDPEDDLKQAESVLFVGVSRAERAAVVSWAVSSSGTPLSKPRRVPQLLMRMESSGCVPVLSWSAEIPNQGETQMGRIWGGNIPSEISGYSLGQNTCRVKTYLEEHLRIRFRGRERSLYPEFVQMVRKTLQNIVEHVITTGKSVSDAEATAIAEAEWPAERFEDHVHLKIYRPRLIRWTRSFARALPPGKLLRVTSEEKPFEVLDSSGVARTIKLHLLAEYQSSTGERFAVALQVRREKGAKPTVNWSELDDYQRLPFVLLYERHGSLEPMVFFGEEGQLYRYLWNRNNPQQAIADQARSARQTAKLLSSGIFSARADDYQCDRCRCRTVCPLWLQAVSESSPPRS
jgi:DNA helicase-2/ATP-dependent DNA helicase PcrA